MREADLDLTGWVDYFTAGLASQLDEVKHRSERAIRLDDLVREHRLSNRQAIAIEHLLEHGRIGIADFERLCPETNRRSLQRDLRAMVDGGLLIARGAGATDPTKTYFLAEPEL